MSQYRALLNSYNSVVMPIWCSHLNSYVILSGTLEQINDRSETPKFLASRRIPDNRTENATYSQAESVQLPLPGIFLSNAALLSRCYRIIIHFIGNTKNHPS